MGPIEPHILHAALRADLDQEEGVYHLRPQIELELPDESVRMLERAARKAGCDLEILCNAVLSAKLSEIRGDV